MNSGRFASSRQRSTNAPRDTNSEGRAIGGNAERSKSSKAPLRAACGRAFGGTSSAPKDLRKSEISNPQHGRQVGPSSRNTSVAESRRSSRRVGVEFVESINNGGGDSEYRDLYPTRRPPSNASSGPATACGTSSTSRSLQMVGRNSTSSDRDASSSSLTRLAAGSRNVRPLVAQSDPESPVYALRKCSCASISNLLPSRLSSAGITRNKKIDAADGERSRCKSSMGSSSGEFSGTASIRSRFHGSNPSREQLRPPQQASVRGRSRANRGDGDAAVSVGTRQPRLRLSARGGDSISPELRPSLVSIPEDGSESSPRSSSSELLRGYHFPCGRRPGSTSQASRDRSTYRRPVASNGRNSGGSTGDRDSDRRINLEGIAEVLLALERIEHEEELTYEQLIVMEANAFMGELSFQDEHQDMRMDIDDLTYEELLALEDEMGTVSTALTKEALSKCLKRSIYDAHSGLSQLNPCGDDGDDIKCSICQEEYIKGDELGKLGCQHWYHLACIHHWLQLKNWCPICKASAATSA